MGVTVSRLQPRTRIPVVKCRGESRHWALVACAFALVASTDPLGVPGPQEPFIKLTEFCCKSKGGLRALLWGPPACLANPGSSAQGMCEEG